MTVPDILRTIAYCKEFDEIPLRHNEDVMNEELAKDCPLEVKKTAMDSPN